MIVFEHWFGLSSPILILVNSNAFKLVLFCPNSQWWCLVTNWNFKPALSIIATVLNKSSNNFFYNHKTQNVLLFKRRLFTVLRNVGHGKRLITVLTNVGFLSFETILLNTFAKILLLEPWTYYIILNTYITCGIYWSWLKQNAV